jgi:phosphatidylglycerophosphate synthase
MRKRWTAGLSRLLENTIPSRFFGPLVVQDPGVLVVSSIPATRALPDKGDHGRCQLTNARATYGDPTQLNSVLASLEKRCLIWLAQRMPSGQFRPSYVLALLAMLGAGLSYWLARISPIGLALVNVSLAVNWFGDSLDGTLARVRQQQRPRYGFYVDHVVDTFGTAFLLGGLALSGYMHPYVALSLLSVYLMVCAEVFLATHCLGTFKMSFMKVGPTELRILLAIGNVALFFQPTATLFGHTYRMFDIGG